MNSKFVYEYVPATDPMFTSPGHAFTDIFITNAWFEEEQTKIRKGLGLPVDNVFEIHVESFITHSFTHGADSLHGPSNKLTCLSIANYERSFVIGTKHYESLKYRRFKPEKTDYFIKENVPDRLPLFIKGHIPDPESFVEDFLKYLFAGDTDTQLPDEPFLGHIDRQKAFEFFQEHNKPILRKLNNKDKRKGD